MNILEHGVVYLTQKKKERKFMRFGELAHFCDGTLLYVYNGLPSRLLTDQIPKTKHNDGKAKVLKAMNLIEEKLMERLMFQIVEAALKLRSRIIGEWDEYLQIIHDAEFNCDPWNECCPKILIVIGRYSDIILWNPLTGHYKTLSKDISHANWFTIPARGYGLYYNCLDDDYKLC
ncbi:hypothetical protein OSB04_028515 [Centaurea solstitialis]|uniref:Uncharacterized protein n=1 Tax=Centaurea solstitialis TaxID=347529 RepID=A0AA38SFQ3_9ASTR|nr:hypothetical protein OSB04_028515 [Centaurea solstitialis]